MELESICFCFIVTNRTKDIRIFRTSEILFLYKLNEKKFSNLAAMQHRRGATKQKATGGKTDLLLKEENKTFFESQLVATKNGELTIRL